MKKGMLRLASSRSSPRHRDQDSGAGDTKGTTMNCEIRIYLIHLLFCIYRAGYQETSFMVSFEKMDALVDEHRRVWDSI